MFTWTLMPSLPNELISKILEHADYKTVTACRRLCRHFKDIVDTTASLRYIIELGATGMCDGPLDAVGPAERLRKLEDSQAAWKSSVWSQPKFFPYSKKIFPIPVVQSGNLAVLKGHAFGRGEFLLLRFPSESRGIPEQLWYLDLHCESVEIIAVDDSQDLLVFSCLPHIHIRTLSSGCVHPLSSTLGLIDAGINTAEYVTLTSRLCIHDDRFAFMPSVGYQIMVWDWKTGKQIVKIPCFRRSHGFSFLDRNSILFPDLFSFPGQEDILRFQVAIFELPNTADEAAFHFYDFDIDVQVLESLGDPGSESSEFLTTNTLPSNPSNSCFPGFFHSEPSGRLLALEVVEMHNTVLRVLYVPHDVLLDYIRLHPSDTTAAVTPVVPWGVWGPASGNAHILTLPDPSPGRRLGSRIVCGMHAITDPPTIIGEGDQKMLRIMDYHSRRIVCRPVTQDTHLEGAVESHGNIPYNPKDIPLPGGLRCENIVCMLGEDVVAVFEYSFDDVDHEMEKTEKVFYHPI
ncbi:hypothetical protein EI94DRAFT_1829564 [Lactarius quietus]|nr:hypothetical protein EI94DRAFT_1829564 [Lactarius quietus]